MRVAVLSDIHSNLEALEAVLEHASGQSVDRIVCLGDLVGYGADPNLCCDQIRELTDVVVAGNHDHASVGLTDYSRFNRVAQTTIQWTSSMLLVNHRRYLERLPLSLEHPELRATLVHSTPSRPEVWWYLFGATEAALEFDAFHTHVCFIGHTHVPCTFVKDPGGDVALKPLNRLRLQEGYRYLINVGSVGQPRDGNPDASYLVFDSESAMCDLHRVSYDLQTAKKKILQAGLPPVLAERLSYGR